MRSAPDNPPENALPAGTKEAAVVGAIAASGYPLQGVVAQRLLRDFSVVEEWEFIDDQSNEHRNLDLLAWRRYPASKEQLTPSMSLLIECKRSRHPYVFFRRVTSFRVPRFPAIAGIPGGGVQITEGRASGSRTIEVSPSEALGLHEEAFVTRGPPHCFTMSRATVSGDKAELSGSESFKDLILPLTKAFRYSLQLHERTAAPAYPELTLCIAVLDAPMLLVEDPQNPVDPVLSPWIRFVRREPNPDKHGWTRTRFYAIDVVHSSYLDTFLTQHLLPFGEEFVRRVGSHGWVLSGKATVDSIEGWTWRGLRPL